ncbi:polysaccharide pyruvyl transferase family protein [Catellatospora paridis]|uniref:polysaccharide pyruvyl transferase family protein n=1 Tax=Catellatospora paridis TaxID=1617086 RepID=UPI0018AF8402|nr:polysaccharide pyruvyl transferase family protein [Catellatospora paridis]
MGDEAMLEALVRRLSTLGDYRFTIASAEPHETAESYGVQAVPRLRFDGLAGQAGLDRLDSIIDAALGDSSAIGMDDAAWSVIRGVAAADAVVIAGGGNLSSLWPELILERVAIGRLAGAFNKPLVVSGQTVGPAFTARDGALVAELLGRARFVGVRDDASVDIVRRLGVPQERIFRTVDDAAFLVPAETEVVEWLPARPYCLVTFSGHEGAVPFTEIVPAIARLLDHVADAGGLEIVFLPHEGVDADDTSGDGAVHRHIAAAMQQPSRALPILPNGVSAELARRAALSVSSRYHPAVFAASAGVPALAVSVDDYTDHKLSGALGSFGQLEGLFSAISLGLGDVEAGFDRLWDSRDAVAAQAVGIAQARRAENDGWWAHLHAAISGTHDDATYRWSEREQVGYLDDELHARSTRLRDSLRLVGAQWVATHIAVRDQVAELSAATAPLAALEREAGQAVADRESALARIAELEVSLKAAQNLASGVADPIFRRHHRREAAYQNLLNSRAARRAYRKLRRIVGR